MRERGIGTQVHYIPVHRQPYYRDRYGEIALPGADAYYSRELSLPLFPAMSDGDVDPRRRRAHRRAEETMTRRLAIIPARGGSKRLPRKNILPFLGRPIIAHTIEAATESGCFTRILVSTEDAEIADAARAAGAEIHQRDPSLATDAATLTDVCLDILASEERAGTNLRYLRLPLRDGAAAPRRRHCRRHCARRAH